MENKNNNKQVQVFNSEIFGGMRVVMRDGEPWFAGKDVSEILAYKDTDKAVREHVDDEDKRIFKPADLAGLTEQQMNNVFKAAGYNWNFVPANIPNRGLFFINESGLYSLILSSKLPSAKTFKRWVTSEVLPTIRKQGMYLTSATAEEAISDPESFIAKALIVANQVLERQNYETVKKLQATFMEWLTVERTKELLTFPVLTAAYLVDEETREPKDKTFEFLLAHSMSEGLSFFHYESDKADSLASCCRLRNEMADNTFSYTLGAGGVSTGSCEVITINFNRLVQGEYILSEVVKRVHMYLMAFRSIVEDYIEAGLLPTYKAGYISLDKQFCTVGINGALEAYEYLHDKRAVRISFKDFLKASLGLIKEINKEAYKKYGVRFNTEFVPAENLGVKNAKWDKEDGLYVTRDCYNSYFYPVEDERLTILDRLEAHNADVSQYLDGGAACHLNLEQLPTVNQATDLIRLAAKQGVPYWTTNVLCTICKDCGRIDPVTRQSCKYCGSKNLDYGTRVIGYLKPISSFSAGRQKEAAMRVYMKGGI